VPAACEIGQDDIVLVIGMALRKRSQRRQWAFFWVCILMGAFSAVITALKWPGWTEAGILRLPNYFGLWSGAIPLALYWCFAFAALYTIPKQTPPTSY
jgi:hypothetical protein